INHYQADAELFTFFAIAIIAAVAVALNLWFSEQYPDFFTALHFGGFQVVASLTTTGFFTTSFSDWPGMAPLLLILLSFIGGCAGSTAGGMKVARLQMVVRQGFREIRQLVHPKGQFVVKVGGKRVSESVVISVGGFCTLYLLCFLVMTLMLTASGVDIITAFSAIAACLNNLGPGLGAVSAHYNALGDVSIWIC